MRMAADAELDLAVHAIGDAAVRGVLDAYEQTRTAYALLGQRMLRIEHAQLIDPQDVPRFASLGAIASMQPIHAVSDWRAADAHWGPRSRYGYAWGDLLRAGVRLAFGTDAPVERIEPLLSIQAAVTRLDQLGEPSGGWYPHQRLTLEDAVRAYTAGSAAAERASARRGSLANGKDADLVVLSPDPFRARARRTAEDTRRVDRGRRADHVPRRLAVNGRTLKPRRSCLSVPASSARMQTKAATLDADQVLFDLEDATAPSEKVGARSVAVDSLKVARLWPSRGGGARE